MKAVINANIYDFENFHEDSYVLFDKEIREVGSMKEFKGADETIDCRGHVVMPGLLNCHTHIYSLFSRGMNIPFNPQNFSDILKQLWWRLDGQLDGSSIYLSGLVYGIDCIKNGVTSLIDHHASGLMIKGSLNLLKKSICNELGLRGVFCFETSDRFNIAECIEENIEFSSQMNESFTGIFGIHASMSLSDKSMEEIRMHSGCLPIHIHAAESMDDVNDCLQKYGTNIVRRLDTFNLLRENSILSHCVHIKEEEAELIKDRGCVIALNPTSNMNNAVGLANYDMLKRVNSTCIIGNDGLGANISREYLNTVFAMKYRLGSPVKFGLDDLLKMIRNGYEYMGNILNIKVGRIKEGYKADMIAIPYEPPTPIDSSNAFSHIFYGIFDNLHPRHVFVSGKSLMKDYNLCLNTEDIYENSRKEAANVWKRMGL